MAGHDPRDSTSPGTQGRRPTVISANPRRPAHRSATFFADGMSDDVRAAVDAALAARKPRRHHRRASLPNARLAILAYVIAPAEGQTNLQPLRRRACNHRAAE